MNNLNPNDLAEELRLAGIAMAETEAAAAMIEDTRRHLRAKLMSESECHSIAKAEMIAESSLFYKDHIEKGIRLRENATIAKVRYETLKIKIELIRSLEATNRAQMKL